MTTDPGTRTEPAEVLRAAYEAFASVVRPLGDEESWLPTGCEGWAVRDLVFHRVGDAQRALVALHTPASGPPDRDAVTYWRDWQSNPVGAANGFDWIRVSASRFLGFGTAARAVPGDGGGHGERGRGDPARRPRRHPGGTY